MGIERQNNNGNKWVISQPYYVNCPKNEAYVKIDLMGAFSKFYSNNYKSGYSYLSNPPVEGPFATLDDARSARMKKIKEWEKDHALLTIDDFRFSCAN